MITRQWPVQSCNVIKRPQGLGNNSNYFIVAKALTLVRVSVTLDFTVVPQLVNESNLLEKEIRQVRLRRLLVHLFQDI